MTTSKDGGAKCTPIDFTFNGRPMTIIEFGGVLHYIAREVGVALDYSDEGRGLIDLIGGPWAAELTGEHVVKLAGARLAEVLFAIGSHPIANPKTRSLLLLTERGLWRVLILSGKPAGARLRDLLDSQVLPQLRRTGTYSLPGARPAIPGPAIDPKRIDLAPVRSKSDHAGPVVALRAVLDAFKPVMGPGQYLALDALLRLVEAQPDPRLGLDAIEIPGLVPDYVEDLDSNKLRWSVLHRINSAMVHLTGADVERLDAWIRTRPQIAHPKCGG